MRVADGTTGTLDSAVCEFPPCLDAIRVLALRYAGAGLIIPRVDLDIPGDDVERKPSSVCNLDLCSRCASFIGSTVLSIPFSGAVGRALSTESSCVTSRTGINWPVISILSCTCAASLSNDCVGAAGCLFVKYRSCCPPLNIDDVFAGRFVAESISLVGTMGRLPVIMGASRKARRLTVFGAERPVPNRSAGSAEIALRIRPSTAARLTLENSLSSRSGAMMRVSFVMLVASVTLTPFNCDPFTPYHG
jgi:hypothetical protein